MRILVVEPRAARAEAVTALLKGAGATEVETVPDAAAALARLSGSGALVTARWLPDMDGGSLAALARTAQKGLAAAVYEDPEKERGVLEDMARRLASS